MTCLRSLTALAFLLGTIMTVSVLSATGVVTTQKAVAFSPPSPLSFVEALYSAGATYRCA
ncbi:MAG: hypothetical protein ABSB81_09760 [Halobacteriota archaeon]